MAQEVKKQYKRLAISLMRVVMLLAQLLVCVTRHRALLMRRLLLMTYRLARDLLMRTRNWLLLMLMLQIQNKLLLVCVVAHVKQQY
jgi:hypothetical protein